MSGNALNLFLSDKVNDGAFQKFPIATLANLCDVYELPVEGTGKRPNGSKKKSDYIDAIFAFVSHQSSMVRAH
jgi:hypothetical protein